MSDAVRRSQYREAIEKASQISDADLDDDEIRELIQTLFLAGSRLLDGTETELAAYARVVGSGSRLLQQFPQDPGIREWIAKALNNQANVLGKLGRTEEALGSYDEVVTRFSEAASPALEYEIARALYNKAITLSEIKESAESDSVYREVVNRFAGSSQANVRGLAALALYNAAVGQISIGNQETGECDYRGVIRQFSEGGAGTVEKP